MQGSWYEIVLTSQTPRETAMYKKKMRALRKHKRRKARLKAKRQTLKKQGASK
jgi:hypothetical protein